MKESPTIEDVADIENTESNEEKEKEVNTA
jgi:hypothetical protein